MIGDIVSALFGSVLDMFVADASRKDTARYLRKEGRVLAAIRVRHGEVAGLSTKWRTFDMKPGRGSLSFDLKVVRVIEAHLRTEPPSQGERLRMPPVVEVVFDIQSDHAQLELGLAAEDADRVERALTGGKRALKGEHCATRPLLPEALRPSDAGRR